MNVKIFFILFLLAFASCGGYVCKREAPAICADTQVIEFVSVDGGAGTWQPKAYPCTACVEWEEAP